MQKRLFILLAVLCAVFVLILFLGRHTVYNFWQKTQHFFVEHTGQSPPTDHINITFLDIGQGDASFIEFPDGTQMLVDCAIDARILEALGRVMSFTDRTIDYLLVTHPDKDHYGGCVDVLQKYDVKHILHNGYEKEKNQYFEVFLQAALREKAESIEVNKEQTFTIASTSIHILYPDAPLDQVESLKGLSESKISNNTSIVFQLQYGKEKVLFTGDAEMETEAYLIKKYGKLLDSDVLKAGHHGSNTSSGQDFLDLVTPEITTISSGKNNEYGHPTPRVLKRLERVHSQVWRTDQKGDILVQVYEDKVTL